MRPTPVESAPSRPPFWLRLSIPMGNLAQVAGIALGIGIMSLAAPPEVNGILRVLLVLVGWFCIYVCCHSLAHWLVGRLVGIRFQGYGLRGTDHPEAFGPRMRAVMSRFPMFTAMTDKASMVKASPVAKALMFAAGETGSILCLLLTGLYAWVNNVPGGILWLVFGIGMSLIGIVTTSKMPGDYAKARKALRG